MRARLRLAASSSERPRDEGSAMIITLMVLAVLVALAATVSSVTINNLGATLKSQQAGAALNAADAGVAQAIAYLQFGVGAISCSPTCAANGWGNSTTPAAAPIPGTAGQGWAAWIEPIAPAPANNPGRYRIHSTGTAKGSTSTAKGSARRAVDVDVEVGRTQVPLGIFGRSINSGGNVTLHNESLFSTGCVYLRSKLTFDNSVANGIDAAYGIPAAVHSSQIITNANGTGQLCSPTPGKDIHSAGQPCYTRYSNSAYDQDRLGGSLVDTDCAIAETRYPKNYGQADADGYNGSFLRDDATLQKLYGVRNPPLSQYELADLRSIAQSQGNLWTKSNGFNSPTQDQAVMYFDLTKAPDNDRVVNLADPAFAKFRRTPGLSANDPACTKKSLIIIIDGGNARMAGNVTNTPAASLFLLPGPDLQKSYGQLVKQSGNSAFIGTIYAEALDFTGTADIWMDGCFVSNLATGLLQVTQTAYYECDRENTVDPKKPCYKAG